MQEYYFLFALAFAYTLFATVQDLRFREVANWLTYSLIAFALSYRAFYAISTYDPHFFLLGLSGFAIMFALGNAFYYMRAFAGGDAKLLMGFGAILPFETYFHLVIFPLFLVLVLFFSGAIYSLFYSIFIVIKNKKTFLIEFKKICSKWKKSLIASIFLFAFSIFAGTLYAPFYYLLTILSLIPILFFYTKALEKSMIYLIPPHKLTEGDWLEENIKINSKITIKKSVHGLSYKDIELLKKYNKPAVIKQGIPFVPAFLITLLTLFVFSTGLLQLPRFFSQLF